MTIASEIVTHLAGDQKFYTIGALTITLKREKRAVSRAIDNLVGVTLKQKRHGNGYAYAATHTPDVSPVVAVKMTPVIVIV